MEDKIEATKKRDLLWNALYYLRTQEINLISFEFTGSEELKTDSTIFSFTKNLVDTDLMVKNTILQLELEVKKLNKIINA